MSFGPVAGQVDFIDLAPTSTGASHGRFVVRANDMANHSESFRMYRMYRVCDVCKALKLSVDVDFCL